MNTEIGDEAAIVFAAQFYSSIGFGKNLQQAFDQAKAALLLKGIAEEHTPVLYVRKGLLAQDIVMVESEALKKSDNVTIMQKIKIFFVIRGYQGESLLDYKKQEVYNGYINYLKSITNKLSISVLIISYS